MAAVHAADNGGTLDRLLGRVRAASAALGCGPGRECFYRGHADGRWPLLPTLLRVAAAKGWDDEKLWQVEADLYWEFHSRARALYSQELTSWDVLFQMREHTVATRLLDWTETLGVALWFAMRPQPPGAVQRCIWLLDPYELNEESWKVADLLSPQFLQDYSEVMGGGEDLEWQTPIALYPVQRNQRLHAQRGYFTMHGERREPLEKMAGNALRHVPIFPQEENAVREFLHTAGIDEHRLFPDLDALARYLHDKYGIQP
jgi:hypothetical protein